MATVDANRVKTFFGEFEYTYIYTLTHVHTCIYINKIFKIKYKHVLLKLDRYILVRPIEWFYVKNVWYSLKSEFLYKLCTCIIITKSLFFTRKANRGTDEINTEICITYLLTIVCCIHIWCVLVIGPQNKPSLNLLIWCNKNECERFPFLPVVLLQKPD